MSELTDLLDRARADVVAPQALRALPLSAARQLAELAHLDRDRRAWAMFVLDGVILRAYSTAAAGAGLRVDVIASSLHQALDSLARQVGVGLERSGDVPDVGIDRVSGDFARVLDQLALETGAFCWRIARNGSLMVTPGKMVGLSTGYAGLYRVQVIRVECTRTWDTGRMLPTVVRLRLALDSGIAPLLAQPSLTAWFDGERTTCQTALVDNKLEAVVTGDVSTQVRRLGLELRVDGLIAADYVDLSLDRPLPGTRTDAPGARMEVTDVASGELGFEVTSTVPGTLIPIDQLICTAFLIETDLGASIASIRRAVVSGQAAARSRWTLTWDGGLPLRVRFRAIGRALLASHRVSILGLDIP